MTFAPVHLVFKMQYSILYFLSQFMPAIVLVGCLATLAFAYRRFVFTVASLGEQVADQAAEVSVIYGAATAFKAAVPHLLPMASTLLKLWAGHTPPPPAPLGYVAEDAASWWDTFLIGCGVTVAGGGAYGAIMHQP